MPRSATTLPLPPSCLHDVLGRDLAEGGVVAGHVRVLRAGVGQAAVDHGHVGALGLDLGHRLGQRGRLEREDDQRVDLGDGREVLQLVGLLGRVGRGLDRDLQVLVFLLEVLLRLVGPVVDAAHEAVRGRGNRNAEVDLFGGKRGQAGERGGGHDAVSARRLVKVVMLVCLLWLMERWNERKDLAASAGRAAGTRR
jgi:hypothetical protein